jgi:hypothetical protein
MMGEQQTLKNFHVIGLGLNNENHENPARISGVPAEIRTQYFRNRYLGSYNSLLGSTM